MLTVLLPGLGGAEQVGWGFVVTLADSYRFQDETVLLRSAPGGRPPPLPLSRAAAA